MKNFRDSLNEHLKNPEFKKEWDALEDFIGIVSENITLKDFMTNWLEKVAAFNVKFNSFTNLQNTCKY